MKRALIAQLTLLVTLSADRAIAQGVAPGWEIGIAAGVGPQTTGTYEHRFTPPLANQPEATGIAGQDVSLRGETGTALAASVTRMFDRHLGAQMVLAAARAPLGGPSSDLAWTLHYTSRQPPDYQPKPVDVTGSVPWPTTDGELRQFALAANLLVRYSLYERVSLAFSGGVSVQGLEGDLSPLGVTVFSEGGHSTLSSETYSVRVALHPVYAVGLDVGTEFAWQLSGSLSLAFELRFFATPATRLDAEVETVLNNADVIHPATPAELNAVAPLQRVELDPSFGAALVGLRYRI